MDTSKLRGQVTVVETLSPSRHFTRGQVAVEFLMYTGVFLVILLASFSIIQLLQTTEIPPQEARILYEQGDTVAQVLQLSVLAGPGFEHNLTLPKRLLGRPYQIEWNRTGDAMVINGTTSTGSANYIYTLPPYKYRFSGCLDQGNGRYAFVSDSCSSRIKITNDGENLSIYQDQVDP